MKLLLLVLLATPSLGATTSSAEELAEFKQMVIFQRRTDAAVVAVSDVRNFLFALPQESRQAIAAHILQLIAQLINRS